MKAKVFDGSMMQAIDAFNKWAKGKALMKDVIIQSHLSTYINNPEAVYMTIIVFHPETPYWDKTEPQPTPPEYTAIEDKQDAIELGVTA